MKKLCAALLICISACAGAQEADPVAWSHLYVIASWEPGAGLVPVLDGISADSRLQTPAMLDSVAELFARQAANARLEVPEARALVTLLTRAKSGRYRQVLEHSGPALQFQRLREAIRDYLQSQHDQSAVQYIAGTVDFDALRAQYVQAALAAVPTDASTRRLGALRAGSSLAEMFTQNGAPHHVEVRQLRILAESLNFRRMLCYYRGAGRVVFGFDAEEGWRLQSVIADPLAFEPKMPYRQHAVRLELPDDASVRMMQLLNGSPLAMRLVLEDSYAAPPVPRDFLDTAAQILVENYRPPRDELTDDANAWIVRLLQQQGGPRYANVIAIARKSEGPKTWKQALLRIHEVPGITRQPFEPGSVSLTGLAKKCPSLYPDVKYTSGRL